MGFTRMMSSLAALLIALTGCGGGEDAPKPDGKEDGKTGAARKAPKEPEPTAAGEVLWGEPVNGIRCGLSTGQQSVAVGQSVALTVHLRNDAEADRVVRIGGVQEMTDADKAAENLLVIRADATGQSSLGKRVALPPGGTVAVRELDIPARPLDYMSLGDELYLTPGVTSVQAVCSPMFPGGQGAYPGPRSGVAYVRIEGGE